MENFRYKFKLMRHRISKLISNKNGYHRLRSDPKWVLVKPPFNYVLSSTQCPDNMHGCLRQHDVLICIFKLLPSSDRKHVRLTCKLWSEVCSTSSFTKGEKLVFRPNCSISEIADLLRNLTFERIHLEFQNQPIARIPEYVWKICGSRIRGLHFYHCHHFDQHCLRMVIEHCENLSDINIDKCGSPLDCATLDYFIERKIKREMLSSFSLLFAKGKYLDADLLRRIFIVFPKIQNFTTGNAYDTPIPDFKDDETSVPPESVTQLKSLVYLHSVYCNGEPWLRAPMIPISTLRLKKFETTLNHYWTTDCNSLKKSLFEFIEAQEELEIINLRKASWLDFYYLMSEEWPLFIKELIFHVLDRCRNLREFRLADSSKILLTEEETAHFFARVAKLKCLAMDVHIFRIQSQSALSASRFGIDTLRVRSTGRDTEELKTYTLGQCSLKHLRMGPLSDELLQEILKTQPDLRTLVLDGIWDDVSLRCLFPYHNSYWFGPSRSELSLRTLRRLEYLAVNESHEYIICKLTKKMANEIQFPSLKHLQLDMKYTLKKLWHIAPNIPALEVLELDTFDLYKWKAIIGVCRLLRNLRRLRVYYVKKPRLEELLQLFHECPNLRCVIQIKLDEVLFFNPFTREISKKSLLMDVRFRRVEDIFDG